MNYNAIEYNSNSCQWITESKHRSHYVYILTDRQTDRQTAHIHSLIHTAKALIRYELQVLLW